MSSECESEGGNRQVQVCVTVERNDCWELFLHAQHWLINKTGLPLQMKVWMEFCHDFYDLFIGIISERFLMDIILILSH